MTLKPDPHAPRKDPEGVRKNHYDKTDMVRRESCLMAGPLKIAAYRVRDPDSNEFSERQYHMTWGNTIIAMMGTQAALLFARFVRESEGVTAPKVAEAPKITDPMELIHDAIVAVEKMPADTRLTNAVVALAKAERHVNNYKMGKEENEHGYPKQ